MWWEEDAVCGARRRGGMAVAVSLLLSSSVPSPLGAEPELPPSISSRLLEPEDLPWLTEFLPLRLDPEVREAFTGSDQDPSTCLAAEGQISPFLEAPGGEIGLASADPSRWWQLHHTVWPRRTGAPIPDEVLESVVSCRVDRLEQRLRMSDPRAEVSIIERRRVAGTPTTRILADFRSIGLPMHLYVDLAFVITDGWYATVSIVAGPVPSPDALTEYILDELRGRL